MISKIKNSIFVLVLVAGCNTGPEFERSNKNDPGSDTFKPDTPTSQDREITEDKHVILRWNDRTDFEDGYLVEKKLVENDTFKVMDTLSADLISFTDSSLALTATTSYRVSPFVYGDNGKIDEISKNYASTIPLNLRKLGELILQNLGEDIRIEWNDSIEYFDAITFGYIEVGNATGEIVWADTISIQDMSITGLNYSKINHINKPTSAFQYDLVVEAHILDPENTYSTFSTSKARMRVNTPTFDAGTYEDEETLLIEWSNVVPDVEAFEIYKGSDTYPFNEGELVASLPGDVDSYRFKQTFEGGLSIGIRGVKYGVNSHIAIEYVPFSIAKLENFRLTPQENSVRLAWDIPENSAQPYTRFILERSVGGKENFEVYTELSPNTIEFTDSNILESEIYYYRIKSASSGYTDIKGTGYMPGFSLQNQINRGNSIINTDISQDRQEVGIIEYMNPSVALFIDLLGNERSITESDYDLFRIQFSGDNRYILLTGDSAGVTNTNVYDRNTLERKFQIERDNLNEPIFLLPDSDKLVTTEFSSSGSLYPRSTTLNIIDINTGEVVISKSDIEGYLLWVMYDRDSDELITISRILNGRKQIIIFNAGNLSVITKISPSEINYGNGFRYDEESNVLYIVQHEDLLTYNFDTGQTDGIFTFPMGNYVSDYCCGEKISSFVHMKRSDYYVFRVSGSESLYLYNPSKGLISLAVEMQNWGLRGLEYWPNKEQIIVQTFSNGTLYYDIESKWSIIK